MCHYAPLAVLLACLLPIALSDSGSEIRLPQLLASIKADWEGCSADFEGCFSSDECCEKLRCVPSKSFKGPRYRCMDIPSRSYRHLGSRPYPSAFGDATPMIGSKEPGSRCESSDECTTKCCRSFFIFRIGKVSRCEESDHEDMTCI